ncbi:hypothetical protein NADFUDRAFT_69797 [Nadsonia fulvescens var. elongata DSM 6958]|uniref:RING-type E3 ubiquitin transferase n=1 Tax=Nadsonia fulvescens var. elongata DSM 6958 TaxID=857566 RepID=A0A1E3PN60_9ASCO|nr:hypothetical protein NADFUDRAFT_69797 [Nadsonia fulvescens var. elongata DSM 6958]
MNSRLTFFIIIILFFFLTSNDVSNQPNTTERQEALNHFIDTKKYEREVLANSTWEQDGYGNLTGLRLGYYENLDKENITTITGVEGIEDASDMNEKSRHSGQAGHIIRKIGTIFPDEVMYKISALWNKEEIIPRRSGKYHNTSSDPELRKSSIEIESNGRITNDRSYFYNLSSNVHGLWSRPADMNIVPIHMPLRWEEGIHVNHTSTAGRIYEDNNSGKIINPFDDDDNSGQEEWNWDNESYPRNSEDDLTHYEGDKIGNITSNEGTIEIKLHEQTVTEWIDEPSSDSSIIDNSINIVVAEVTLKDKAEVTEHSISLKGLHFIDSGNLMLTTSSSKFAGLCALPQFLPDNRYFNISKENVIKIVDHSINILEESMEYQRVTIADEFAVKKCEFVAFLHSNSIDYSQDELEDIEKELKHPIGRPHRPIPNISMSGILYSPDCGIVIEYNSVDGLRDLAYWGKMKDAVLIILSLLALQIVLLTWQMSASNTPSTMSKISFWTIGLFALVDGAVCMSSLVYTVIDSTNLVFMATAFLSFILASLFEIRFMIKIYCSQIPEAIADQRARLASTSTGDTLPVTNTPEPTIEPTDERQVVGSVYFRFYFSLIFFIIFTLQVISWRASIRHFAEYLLLISLYSFWVPQIYRNVQRGTRRSPLMWQFILGSSVVRVLPILYLVMLNEGIKVINHRQDTRLGFVLIAWLGLQILVLYLQQLVGPRFFVPKGIMPKVYNYHPILVQEDEESGRGFSVLETGDNYSEFNTDNRRLPESNHYHDNESAASLLKNNNIEGIEVIVKGDHHGHDNINSASLDVSHQTDCAICMSTVSLIIVPKDNLHLASTPGNILARQKYMITPCKHVFHTECMETWMRTKLQCPVCRTPLPSI